MKFPSELRAGRWICSVPGQEPSASWKISAHKQQRFHELSPFITEVLAQFVLWGSQKERNWWFHELCRARLCVQPWDSLWRWQIMPQKPGVCPKHLSSLSSWAQGGRKALLWELVTQRCVCSFVQLFYKILCSRAISWGLSVCTKDRIMIQSRADAVGFVAWFWL